MINIRQMLQEDLCAVVNIHIVQFPNSRSTQLGKPFLRKMYNWFILNQPKLALVSELDGKVIGFVVGAIGGYGRKIFRFALPQIILGLFMNPKLIFRKQTFQLWQSFLKGLLPKRNQTPRLSVDMLEPLQTNAALSSLAVDKEYQSKGVGKTLVKSFEMYASQAGAQTVSLTVEKENHAAIHLYKISGWVTDSENDQSNHFQKILS